MRVRCEGPTIDLYTFTATFTDNDGSEFSLSKNEVLLRGCSLKNTDHALAVAVYTGHQTKLALNAGCVAVARLRRGLLTRASRRSLWRSKPPSKRTTLERHLNRQIVLMMIFQGIVVFIAALLAGIFQQV